MAYADEPLIQMMNGYKSGQQGTLETGIYIKEELFEFESVQLFDHRMSVMLPKKFTDMPLEQAKIKYPMEQRPQIIKTNEKTDINFTFSLLEQELSNEHVAELNDYLYHVFKRAQPVNTYYEKKAEPLGENKIGWFDFKSHGLDHNIYNVMYCTPIDGKMLHGIFNSPIELAEVWKPVVLQVMQSICDFTCHERGESNA